MAGNCEVDGTGIELTEQQETEQSGLLCEWECDERQRVTSVVVRVYDNKDSALTITIGSVCGDWARRETS